MDSSLTEDGYETSGPFWQGMCVYKFELPRWMQKRRQTDIAEDKAVLKEPRRATAVAVNARFSLIAIGTLGGVVHLVSLPTGDDATPPSQPLIPPVSTFGSRTTGAVVTMEWSSDGYVLAVGWEHGWAIWSVGGWCLASSFDLEEQFRDETRFQDAFMYGVKQLVSRVVLRLQVRDMISI
jgi:hypothetical protein